MIFQGGPRVGKVVIMSLVSKPQITISDWSVLKNEEPQKNSKTILFSRQ